MDNLAGVIIMAICTFGCALLFYGIGIWAENSSKPVHFWSGSKVDPSKVLDIPAYNHACAVMWKRYSVPYWCCGILAYLDLLYPGCMMISVIMLLAACLPGAFWLVSKYTKIEQKYIIK